MDTATSAIKAYGFPVSNRSDGFDVNDIISLFEKLAEEINEPFTIEVYDHTTKELTGVFPINPIEVCE